MVANFGFDENVGDGLILYEFGVLFEIWLETGLEIGVGIELVIGLATDFESDLYLDF